MGGQALDDFLGQSFESYLQEHIFVPMGMDDTTVGPSPDAAQPVAVGYRYWFGVPRAAHRNYGRVINPAAGVIASAEAMTHYLIAQLNGGCYRDAQILAPSGIAELHRPRYLFQRMLRKREGTRRSPMGWAGGPRRAAECQS
jgi:CubicO group peptidase (beta-lactamase class C family)